MCSPQLDPGVEEAREGSEVGEVAADRLQILRLSVLGVRVVDNDDPEDGVGCAASDEEFNVEGVGHRFPEVHYILCFQNALVRG